MSSSPSFSRFFALCAILLCSMALPAARGDLRFATSEVEVSEADGEVRLIVERTGDLSQSFKAYCDLSVRRWKGEVPQAPFIDSGVEVTAVEGDDVFPFARGISIEFPSSDADPQGAARQTLVIPISNAARVETSDRTFLVRLITQSGDSCLGSNPPASVTIRDDDQARPFTLNNATHIALLRYGGAKDGRVGGWLRVRTTRSGLFTGTICFGIGGRVKQFKGRWNQAGSFSIKLRHSYMFRGTVTVGGTFYYELAMVARGDSFEAVAMNVNRDGYHGGSWFYAGTAKKLVAPTSSELDAYKGEFAFRLQDVDFQSGKGRIIVDSHGSVRMLGHLNDGRRFALASRLFAGGDVPIPNSYFLNAPSRIGGSFVFTVENSGIGELDYSAPYRFRRGNPSRPRRAFFEALRVK